MKKSKLKVNSKKKNYLVRNNKITTAGWDCINRKHNKSKIKNKT